MIKLTGLYTDASSLSSLVNSRGELGIIHCAASNIRHLPVNNKSVRLNIRVRALVKGLCGGISVMLSRLVRHTEFGGVLLRDIFI